MTTRRDLSRGLLWISPWLLGFAVFLALPLGMTVYYSLTDYSLVEEPVFVGLDNYREMLGDALFWKSLRNTAVYATAYIVVGTIIAIALAVLLDQRLPGVTAAQAIVFLPTLVPLVAAALGWMWVFDGENGLLNVALERLGVRGPDYLTHRHWAMVAILVISFWQLGGAVVIYLAALRDVPRSLVEAASLDGAGARRRLVHVTLPMISPAILFNVVMATIWSLQVFAVPFIMTRGGPDNATWFLTHHVYANGFPYGRMGYASALAWVQFLAILVLTGVILLASRRFVHYRGAVR